MAMSRYWPHCLVAGLFAPLGIIAPKGEVPLLLVAATAALVQAVSSGGWRLRGRNNPWGWNWTLLVCGLLWALISIVWTLDPLSGLSVWARLAGTVLAAYLLVATMVDMDDQSCRLLAKATVAGFVVAVVMLAADQASGLAARAWYYEVIDRPGAFDPTLLNRPGAILLLAGWTAALALIRLGQTRFAVLPPVLAGVLAISAVSSSNKLAGVAACLVAALVWRFPGGSIRVLALAISALAILSPVLPQTALSPSLLEDRIDGYDSGLHRLYIWEFSANRIFDRPFGGWGLDASPLIPGGEEKLPEGGNRMNVHPHNGFLQIWLELGAIGAICLAAWLYRLARSLERIGDNGVAACAAGTLVTALVIANLSYGIWQTWWMSVLALTSVLAGMVLCNGSREMHHNRVI